MRILHGQAESKFFSREQCECGYGKQRRVGYVLGQPTQRSRRLLSRLAGLEVSPQQSSPHPSPTSPHPHGAERGHSSLPKAVQAPPGCIFLANYLLFS